MGTLLLAKPTPRIVEGARSQWVEKPEPTDDQNEWVWPGAGSISLLLPSKLSSLCAVWPDLLPPFCAAHTASLTCLAFPTPCLQRSYFTAPCEEFLYGPGLYREKGQAIKGQAWLPALWLNIDNTRRQRPGESTPRIPLRCRNPQTGGPLSPFLRAGKRVWMFSLYMRPPYKNVSTGLLVL